MQGARGRSQTHQGGGGLACLGRHQVPGLLACVAGDRGLLQGGPCMLQPAVLA